MEAGRDFLLFITFIVILGIAWYVTGGPSRTISHQGWFLNPSAPLGSGQGYNIPSIPIPSGGDSGAAGSGSSGNASEPQANAPSIWDYFFNYRAGVGVSATPATSPYAQYIYLEQGQSQSSDPAFEYIVIRSSQDLKTSLTISGWTLESAIAGIKVTIGSAAQVPFLGQVNSKGPISIGPGTAIVVTTGRSPNGTSFRLNECTGYFEQFQDFRPSLPKECPRPEDEMLRYPETLAGNDACQEFIQTIPQCILTVTSIPGNIGSGCQNFILTVLSYNGCIAAHKNDPDFYRNSWRVFLERDQELWKNTHDAIRLLDENGKLVAQVSY